MTSHLLGLKADNFKRLTLADISFDPDGGVVAIMGANEAGKSSLLDALEVAIAGRKAPKIDEPVHSGADKARIVATFDDIIVTRTYTTDGKTTIEVKGTDGRKFGNTEDILRALYSHVSLDPFAFSKLTSAEQVATLLPLIGFDPKPLDAERQLAFDRRTDVNREVKSLQARLDAFPTFDTKLPTELISVGELSEKLAAAERHNASGSELKAEIARRRSSAEHAEARLEAARAALRSAESEATEAGVALTAAIDAAKTFEAQDTEALRAEIDAAENTNDRIRKQADRSRVAAELAEQSKAVEALTAKIEDVRARRSAALMAAKMPVPGLSINEEGDMLTLNDLPFSGASTGVKIRTGVAIAMALNPDLRLIVIRDASLLDASNRKLIDEIAKANGFTVLAEFADTSSPIGVIIEDGTVKEVRA